MLMAGGSASLAYAQSKKYEGRQLVASVFGGKSQDIIQQDVFNWLNSETGISVTGVPLLSAAAFARLKAEAASPQIDLFNFSGGQQVQAKAEDLTQPLTLTPRMQSLPETFRDPDNHWLSWGVIAEGILYRTDKIQTPPTSYLDFLKPEYRGHIAFPNITNGYGVDFLVMMARAHGGDENNIDPGFEALKQIAADASIFRAAPDVQTQFAQNDVWIMPYDSASALVSASMGLPVAFAPAKEGVPSVYLTGCVAKNSKNADLATEMLDRLLQPEIQLKIAQNVGWGPTNPEVVLPPEIAGAFPSPDQLINLDRAAIAAQHADWTKRFSQEIAR